MDDNYDYPSAFDDSSDTVDYSEIVKDSVLIGEYPYETIIEGITAQFKDYINTQDHNDYVDIFYTELKDSYEATANDNDNEHPGDIFSILDDYKNGFVSTITELFSTRLAISLLVEDDINTEEDEVEILIRRLYEFFILNARHNFKYIISHDIATKLPLLGMGDKYFYQTVDDMLTQYSPLCIALTPTEFIKASGNEEVYGMYESMQFTGNFLRKYSPKLYANDDLKAEIVAEVTLLHETKEDPDNGSEQY